MCYGVSYTQLSRPFATYASWTDICTPSGEIVTIIENAIAVTELAERLSDGWLMLGRIDGGRRLGVEAGSDMFSSGRAVQINV